MKRTVLLPLLTAVFVALFAGYTLGTASNASAACKTSVTDGDGGGGLSMATSVDWCYNGSVVTSQSNSTTHGDGGTFYYWAGYATNSYCCVGQWEWHLNRIGQWNHVSNPDIRFCVRNEMHLYGNGTYSTNPGEYIC